MPGVTGVRGIAVLPFGQAGAVFDFDLGEVVFTPSMAKRAGIGPWAASPIYQGAWDGTGTPDVVTYPRGAQIGNPTEFAYSNFDPYQGTIVLWIRPEWDGDDGLNHWIISPTVGTPGNYYIYKTNTNILRFTIRSVGDVNGPSTAAWTAGTTYCVMISWDSKKAIDGTNHVRFSVNDAQTYARPSAWTVGAPDVAMEIGSYNSTNAVNAIIAGPFIYRRVLYDGAYGDRVNGNLDELAAIYAAGAGADPCTITGTSWDVTLGVPTNSTVGPYTTGALDAWSHPILSSIVTHMLADDGYYGGGEYAIIGANNTQGNAGSAAALDDMPDGANGWTWDGWIRVTTGWRVAYKGNQTTTGWQLNVNATTGQFDVGIQCATTDARAITHATAAPNLKDGKWHHVAVAFHHVLRGGDGLPYVAIDGKWVTYATHTAGVGAYQADAATNLGWGHTTVALQGGWGWRRHSNTNGRYTVGTDFVPPRAFPAADGNTIEAWSMADGTGNTAVAQVASPGNDAALTNHTWEEQWEPDTSPVIPQSVYFGDAGTNSMVSFGSGASIDDLPTSPTGMTLEWWMRLDGLGTANASRIWNKGEASFFVITGTGVDCSIYYDTTTTRVSYAAGADGCWHHWAITYDEGGDRRARLWMDGVLVAVAANASVGNYVSDAASTLVFSGRWASGTYSIDGAGGWCRYSDTVRYTSTFIPPSRDNPPGNDANAQLLCWMQDGAGTTATDISGNANHGTLNANCIWNNTPDMAVDSPGKRFGNGGYAFGADAANDGIEQIRTGLTPGDGYVVRAEIAYDPDGRAESAIRVYDNIGAAQIVQFVGPRLEGAHTGANNSATLIDATARWPQSLIGAALYNITDGSSTTITAVSGDGTTITGVLAGGTDNDWDTGDVYMIQPGDTWSWTETFCFTLPAACTSIQVQIRNLVNEGMIYVNQIEVLENIVSGTMEAGAGNPWIPTGWNNLNFALGEAAQDAAVFHSGANSWGMVAAGVNHYAYEAVPGTAGRFYGFGCWAYDVAGAPLIFDSITSLVKQATTVTTLRQDFTVPAWTHYAEVARLTSNPGRLAYYSAGAGSSANLDDVYVYELTPITLTVTPASAPNSLESGGIRIDGRDTGVQPIPVGAIGATRGHIRWRGRLRHPDPIMTNFAEGAGGTTLMRLQGAANFIRVDFSAANAIRLSIDDGVLDAAFVINPGFVADQEYLFELRYTAVQARLIVDGVTIVTLVPVTGINFGVDVPVTAYWGSRNTGAFQADVVFVDP